MILPPYLVIREDGFIGRRSRVETRLKISKLVDPTFLTSTSERASERELSVS